MRIVEKPWGNEKIWAETDKYVGKILVINPGHRLSLQYHEIKEETIMVLTGVLRIWESESEKDFFDLTEGVTYHVKPKEIHRFGATSFGPVSVIEVSSPEIEDVVRLSDDYKLNA